MADDSRLTFARGDVVSRKYEIENHLGDGIFGKTYLARHIASGRHVAIKFIKPHLLEGGDAAERLKSGFAAAKKVRHPGLIRYGEVNEHNGLTYITQEYFKSQSLRQVMDENLGSGQVFTLQDACQIVIKVLEALQVGHDAGLIHRNLKPENILIHTTRSGPGGSKVVRNVKVGDLGVVDMFASGAIGDRYDSDDSPYLAPELSGFGSDGNPQADVYSVGVTLYELLCGQVPRGTFLSPTQVREDLPEHVDHLVELALSPDSGDRYPTARDMVFDIQRSFNLEMQAGTGPKTSLKNILIGIGVGIAGIVLAGLYIAGREPVDHSVDKAEQDELVRKEVMAANPLPSDAIQRTMAEAHPDMVWIPGGTFVSGRLSQEDGSMSSRSERLAQVVQVDDFYIDRFEFPNRLDEVPVAKASYADAEKACSDAGKRVCTSIEWEKACKGPGNYVYSYGDTWDPSMCGTAMDEPYKAGGRKDCVSGYGAFDMSGGFREWTSTSPGGKETRKVVKGGQRGNAERGSRCAFSVDEGSDYAEGTLTFRCCLSVDENGATPEPAPEGAPEEGTE